MALLETPCGCGLNGVILDVCYLSLFFVVVVDFLQETSKEKRYRQLIAATVKLTTQATPWS